MLETALRAEDRSGNRFGVVWLESHAVTQIWGQGLGAGLGTQGLGQGFGVGEESLGMQGYNLGQGWGWRAGIRLGVLDLGTQSRRQGLGHCTEGHGAGDTVWWPTKLWGQGLGTFHGDTV